MANNRIKADAG